MKKTEHRNGEEDPASIFPGAWQAGLLALAVPGIQLIEKGTVLTVDLLFNTSFQREPMTVLVTSLLSVPLVALTASLFTHSFFLPSRPERGFAKRFLAVLGCLVMAGGMALVASAYFQWAGPFMPTMETWNRLRGFTTRQATPLEAWMIFAALSLLLPAFEEWLFRGIILRGLLQSLRPTVAIAVSSVLFSLAHAEMGGGVVAFISSLIWGWWYLRTRSLSLCIMGHTAQNAVSLGVYILFLGDLDAVPAARCALWGGVMLAVGFWLCRTAFTGSGTALDEETMPAGSSEPR
jgi:membrane protease YdiL (CAAX protease family)